MDKPEALRCPNCGAPLEYEGSDEPTIACPYCHTTVIVPQDLRTRSGPGQPSNAGPVFVVGPPQPVARGRRSSCVGIVIALVLLVVVAAVGISLAVGGGLWAIGGRVVGTATADKGGAPTLRIENTPIVPQIKKTAIPSLVKSTPTPSFARVALTFGSKGTGPGLFTDARHIALDGESNVYVGEYSNGRIQVFNASSGKFLSLWMVDDDAPVLDLAADRQGMVYVVQQGVISIYEGASGEFQQEVAYAGGQGFNDIAVTADGGLVASWYRAHDDLVRFDRQREVVWIVESAISGQSDGSELNMRVSVDGLGTIYALGSFSHAVFQFSSEGKYVNRFGGQGHEPGQFRAERAVAVDGKGRVYVADSKGIQVFDADGRYLDVIDVKGAIFGMAFDDQGGLWVAARDKVIKFELVGQ